MGKNKIFSFKMWAKREVHGLVFPLVTFTELKEALKHPFVDTLET